MSKFQGKVVLVTGASNGIGASTAIAFANAGAKVVVTGRNKERLAQVAKKCRSAQGCQDVLEIIADLAVFDNLKLIIDKTVEKFGTIDILVNNAGIGLFVPIDLMAQKQYEDLFDTNLRAPFFLSQQAWPHLKKTKGCVINVSSIASSVTGIGISAYASTKAALDHFTRNLAAEGAVHGVRVNGINPGLVETGFVDAMGLPDEIKKPALKKYLEIQPLGMIQPEDIAEGIIFLASSSKTTGITLVMDGGRTIRPL